MEEIDKFKKPDFILPLPPASKSKGPAISKETEPSARSHNPNVEILDPTINLQTSTTVTTDFPSKNDAKILEQKVLPKEIKSISASEKKAKNAAMLAQLKYNVPKRAAAFDSNYSLEVLKNGSIIDKVIFTPEKSFYVIGRSPGCDIVSEHLTFSRTHGVFQFIGNNKKDEQPEEPKTGGNDEEIPQVEVDTAEMGIKDKGLYIFDLNSTHGTFLNKNQLYPLRYYRLRVGHVLKFGNSTRIFVVTGPSDDEEEESEKTVTELLKERLEKDFERKKLMENMKSNDAHPVPNVEEEGISWGMSEDAVEETDLSVNPFSTDFETTETNFDNPKKTLLGWFEREGYSDELFYDVREKTNGHFICRINLPLDGSSGAPVFAEVDGKGKKREIVAQCALKACQILDKYGVLRQSHREGFKRKMKDWEDKDYYSSDEDTFLDRTGSVEKKRTVRMAKAGKTETKTETYESLSEKHTKIQAEIDVLNRKMAKAEANKLKEDSEVDPLDAFMQHLKTGATDMAKMKTKMKELTEELKQTTKLMGIAAPSILVIPPPRIPKLPQIPICAVVKSEYSESMSLSSVSIKGREVIPIPYEKSDQMPVIKKLKFGLNESEDLQSKIEFEETSQENVEDELSFDPESKIAKNLNEPSKSKRKRSRFRHQHQPKKAETQLEYDSNKPEYSNWVPPTDQRGDGWTKLNEKLGY